MSDPRLEKKDRLTVFVPKGKGKELKINALKVGMSVSDYISFMGTATVDDIIKLRSEAGIPASN